MTDTLRLKKIINDSGIKWSFLAKKLGVSSSALSKKFERNSDFKAWQMFVLVDLLHLSDEDAREIFFADNVDGTSTNK